MCSMGVVYKVLNKNFRGLFLYKLIMLIKFPHNATLIYNCVVKLGVEVLAEVGARLLTAHCTRYRRHALHYKRSSLHGGRENGRQAMR